MSVKPKDVPVFILAGGMGSRISEESHLRPKPMIEIGEIPILVHIMRWYYSFGYEKFVICSGYRSWMIKEYFLSYEYRRSHLVIDHRRSTNQPPFVLNPSDEQEKWEVHVLDTGLEAMTGARLARALDTMSTIMDFDHFAATYGDGVTDAPLGAELMFHLEHQGVGTVLGVPPIARFGELAIDQTSVTGFIEKPQERQGLINGGYFLFRKGFRDYLSAEDRCILEDEPLERLTQDNRLKVFAHRSFWHPMDTLRDKNVLQALWEQGKAPWKVHRRQPAVSRAPAAPISIRIQGEA
jgi:glucose-1-phosphate cytidylyltransferase